MRYIVIAMCLVFLFLFFMNKESRGKAIEYFAWFWFKFAAVIALLFVINYVLSFVKWGIQLPVNLFSVVTITILGLPGIICVSFLMIMKKI